MRNINESERARPRGFFWGFIALTVLIILFGLAFLVSGREIIQRPGLVIFLFLAWLGMLGGIAIGRSTD